MTPGYERAAFGGKGIVALALAGLLVVSIVSSAGSAFSQNFSDFFGDEITGAYSNERLGVQVTFPDGWTGFETSSSHFTMVGMLRNDATMDASYTEMEMIALIVTDLPGMASSRDGDLVRSLQDGFLRERLPAGAECSEFSADEAIVNGYEGIELLMECMMEENSIKARLVAFSPDSSRTVTMYYMARPASNYDGGIGDFEQALQSLKISEMLVSAFTIVSEGTVTLENDTASFAKGNHTVSVELTGEYTFDGERVKVDRSSLSGTMTIDDGATEDLRVLRVKVTNDLNKVFFTAKGKSGIVTGRLVFPSAVDFDRETDMDAAEGKSKLKVKVGSVSMDAKKTATGGIFFDSS